MSALDLIRGNKTERKPKAPRPKCKLCGEVIGNGLLAAVPILDRMASHLSTQHADEFAKGQSLYTAFPGFLVCCAFEIHDPKVLQNQETVRAALFALTRKNGVSDDSLLTLVASLGLGPEDAKKVYEAMKALRNACCEFGEWAPQSKPATLVAP
jgi:hypothetical protein